MRVALGFFTQTGDSGGMCSDTSETASDAIAVTGMVVFIAGMFLTALFWGQMQRIEALGLLGQAAYESEYQSAVQNLSLAVGAAALGFSFLLMGAIGSLQATLKDLSEQ
jgi:hypothetical protein